MLLIADSKPQRGAALAELFHIMGIVAFTRRPISALSEISPQLSAVLLVEPDELLDTQDLVDRMHRLCRTVPVFALSKAAVKTPERFSEVFITEHADFSLLLRMRERCKERNLRPVGDYVLAGMDASFYEKGVKLRGSTVPFTKTERMILRYLFSVYPSRVPSTQIVHYAFRPDRVPEPSCVRAHICAINQKAERVLGHPLVDSVRELGYRVITPEVLEDRRRGIFN